MRVLLSAAVFATAAALALAASPPPTHAAPPATTRSGAQVVDYQCVLCHGAGTGGAPRIGDRNAWERRSRAGLDALVRSATAGRGGMPPKGGLDDLSEQELRAAVVYMLQLSNAAEP